VFVPIFYTNFFNGTVWCPWWSKSSQIQQIKVLLLHYLSTHTLDNGSNSWFCLSQSMYFIFFIGIFKQNYKRFLNLFYNKTYQILIIELFQINFNFFTFFGIFLTSYKKLCKSKFQPIDPTGKLINLLELDFKLCLQCPNPLINLWVHLLNLLCVNKVKTFVIY